MAADDEGNRFDRQQIVVTVPASFDQDAQRLTLDAAAMAGYPSHVRLLEEPQAAFHAWVESHAEPRALAQALAGCESGESCHVLVCDIGGGTTDLSLFAVTFVPDAPPRIDRVAVSDHILLGGDNIDLALAHHLESQLTASEPLSAHAWQQLVNRCRDLKEQALTEEEQGEREYRLALTEPGAALFTQTRVATVSREAILRLLDDGFFPRCELTDTPRTPRAGLRELGLPYAADSAVTHYLADFLQRRPRVDAVLFNGGTLTPTALRQRLVDQIGRWQGSRRPVMLANDELYLAVARGAAQFGRELAQGKPRLISAGASHGFYLELESGTSREAAHLVCVLPLGTDVEEVQSVSKLDLHLRVNQPVEFRAFSSVRRSGDHTGQIVRHSEHDFRALPPLHTIARLDTGQYRIRAQTIPVTLESRLNALGLLQVYLVSSMREIEPPQRWQLELDIRKTVETAQQTRSDQVQALPPLPDEVRTGAYKLLESRFDQTLLSKIEKLTGVRKEKWNRVWLRELWKPLSESVARRHGPPEFEAAWLNAAGFLLRPGYGVVLDDYRMEQLWGVYDLGLVHPELKSVREQYYVLWRRVSGGLGPGQQLSLYDDAKPLISSHVKQAAEAIRMACSFEFLPREKKEELMTRILEGMVQKPAKRRGPYLWGLGRLLGRVPLYAGEQAITPPEWVGRCFEIVRPWDWRAPGLEYASTLFALACRKTSSRRTDVQPGLRAAVLHKMEESRAREPLIRQVAQFVPLAKDDLAVIFGESLPSGLEIRTF